MFPKQFFPPNRSQKKKKEPLDLRNRSIKLKPSRRFHHPPTVYGPPTKNRGEETLSFPFVTNGNGLYQSGRKPWNPSSLPSCGSQERTYVETQAQKLEGARGSIKFRFRRSRMPSCTLYATPDRATRRDARVHARTTRRERREGRGAALCASEI